MRYVVPTLNDLRLVSPLATGNMHVFVSTDLIVTAPAMTGAGQINDRGRDYQVFTAANVPAEQTVTVGLTPTPHPKSGAGPFAIAGIVILLLVVTFSVWRIKGGARRRHPGRLPPASDTPRRAPSQRVAPREETEVLLEEIAAIDVAFEEGLLEPATYERVRASAKERLAAVARGASSS